MIRPLVALQPAGRKTPAFLIPGAYLEVMVWKRLVSYMDTDRPLYGVQPMRSNHNLPSRLSIEQAASLFVRDIKDIQNAGPYLLIGYSMGGMIAFEMARQFSKQGEEVSFLCLVDSLPPGPRREANLADRLRIHLGNLQDLPWLERFQYLRDHTRSMLIRLSRHAAKPGALPINRLIAHDRLAAARLAMDRYSPEEIYPGPVTIFRVTDHPWYIRWDPLAAWQSHIQGKLTTIDIPGDHATVMQEPFVQELAMKLKTCLAETDPQK
jgi:thioesterase domain-containing protein